jgi:phosphate ABC transporter permease protein PstC
VTTRHLTPRSRQGADQKARIDRRPDAILRTLATSAGYALIVLMAAVGIFLLVQAIPALAKDKANFLTFKQWMPDDAPAKFGILAITYGTLVTALLALLISLPIALGVALFIAHYAPRRLAGGLGYTVDLLAAVPSVVFGLWGLFFLVPHTAPVADGLSRYLGWIPLFAADNHQFGRSIFNAAIVLAIMILPIITALSREVFLQTPRDQVEAAYALGATHWEMIRLTVLPFGRSGVLSAAVLGLGRALGETIAVALVLSANFELVYKILQPGGNTIAANIAIRFADAQDVGRGALIASGLVLFVVTFFVNYLARAIAVRGKVAGATS